MPENLINWPLLKNPVNWIIVVLMLVIAGFVLDIILTWLAPRAASRSDGSASATFVSQSGS
jgi:hypothetical protein